MTDKTGSLLAQSILLSISALFMLKYGARISWTVGIAGAAMYVGMFVMIEIFFLHKLHNVLLKKWIVYGIIILIFFTVGIFAHIYIPLENLKIDRWSVIDSFLTNFYQGIHPYFARSSEGNLPGPMPFYFVFHALFYSSKTYFISSVMGVAGFLLISREAANKNALLFCVIFLCTCPFLYYETATRSNVFANAVLVLWSLNFILYAWEKQHSLLKIVAFILMGFAMSTRGVFIIPAIVYMLYLLKNAENKISVILHTILSIVAFLCTFLPLLIYFTEDTTIWTPITIQSGGLMPVGYSISAIVVACIIAIFAKKSHQLSLYTGLLLFAVISIYCIRIVVLSGFYRAIVESEVDITYFIFCVPFLLYYLLFAPSAYNSTHR